MRVLGRVDAYDGCSEREVALVVHVARRGVVVVVAAVAVRAVAVEVLHAQVQTLGERIDRLLEWHH